MCAAIVYTPVAVYLCDPLKLRDVPDPGATVIALDVPSPQSIVPVCESITGLSPRSTSVNVPLAVTGEPSAVGSSGPANAVIVGGSFTGVTVIVNVLVV